MNPSEPNPRLLMEWRECLRRMLLALAEVQYDGSKPRFDWPNSDVDPLIRVQELLRWASKAAEEGNEEEKGMFMTAAAIQLLRASSASAEPARAAGEGKARAVLWLTVADLIGEMMRATGICDFHVTCIGGRNRFIALPDPPTFIEQGNAGN